MKLKYEPELNKKGKESKVGMFGIHFYKENRLIKSFVEKYPRITDHIGTVSIIFFIISLLIAIVLIMLLIGAKIIASPQYDRAMQTNDTVLINSIEEVNNITSIGIIVPSLGDEVEIKRYLIFIPALMFIFSLLIISTIHELGHYMMALRYKVPVERYGFGFMTVFKYIPIPIAMGYVNLTMEILKEKKLSEYWRIICSGVGFNILFGISLFLLPVILPVEWHNILIILTFGVGLANAMPLFFTDGSWFFKRLFKRTSYFGISIPDTFSVFLLAMGSISFI